MAAYEYVNRYYGLQVKPGMRVATDGGDLGVVIRKRCYDHRVHVRIDGAKRAFPYHPLDLTYLKEPRP
jgi:hypothetical protein